MTPSLGDLNFMEGGGAEESIWSYGKNVINPKNISVLLNLKNVIHF